jgi:hypothetical protein
MTTNDTTSQITRDTQLQELRGFGAAHDYDVGYLEELLEASPEGYQAFGGAQPLSSFRSVLPLDAHFIARIATMLAEDCSACAQLNLRLAAEAGVERELLERVLQGPEALAPLHRDVFEHAIGVGRGEPTSEDRLARLRDHLGEAGLAELGLTITGSRIFPTLKRALGHLRSCPPLNLEF